MKWKNLTRTYVLAVLQGKRGDRAGAARILGMGVRTLNMKLKKWGILEVSPPVDTRNNKERQDV